MAAVPLATALAANPAVRSLVVKPCANFEAALQPRSTKTTSAPHIGESPHALGVRTCPSQDGERTSAQAQSLQNRLYG
mgnify:CR=1 FL=1